jgi:hypothetical protein
VPGFICALIPIIATDVPDPLFLVRLLRAAADDLNLVGLYGLAAVVQLEGDIADQEGPDFVAEAVRVKGALCSSAGSACLFMRALSPVQSRQRQCRNARLRRLPPPQRQLILPATTEG